jgi:hypothetical protein
MTDQHYAEPEAEGAARAAQLAAMSLTVLEAVARLRAQRAAERADADERMAAAARAERIADHAGARIAWAPATRRAWTSTSRTTESGPAQGRPCSTPRSPGGGPTRSPAGSP